MTTYSIDQDVTTTSNPQFAAVNVGDASDTTLSRASAGVVSVEGVNVLASNAAGVQTFLTGPSSSNLAAAVTDETGTGALVFGTSPTITTGQTVNTGVSAGTIATPFRVTYNSVADTLKAQVQQTTGVSTSATVILDVSNQGYSGLVVVRGDAAADKFSDFVHFNGNNAVVVSTTTANGSPAARTYDANAGDLRLTMASGTYSVVALAWLATI